MRFASSVIARSLSNGARAVLNSCARLIQAALPQHCMLCSAGTSGRAVCDACYIKLPWLPPVQCPQCALPTPRGHVCGTCLSHPPRFDAVSAAFIYEWPLAPLIHHYKYAGNLALARFFADAFTDSIKAPVDAIIPMPLSPQRLRERGFNQALEIAREVSSVTGIPLVSGACRRVRDSTAQAGLPWNARAKNIRGAFVCDIDLSGKRVAVLDDVLTTGSTLNEIARNLRKAGAIEIHGWMMARTLPR